MAKWFGKDAVEIPAELESLTPAQIIEAAKEAAAAKAKAAEVDDLKQKLEAAPKASDVEALKAKIAELEKRPPIQDPPPDPNKDKQPQRISFLEDEDAAFNQRAVPIVNAVFGVAAQTAQMAFENSLSGVDKRMFEKYGNEMRELMSKEPPQNQASPYSWKTGWDIIKGRHAVDIAKAASEKTDFFAEVPVGDPNAGPARTSDPNTLTDDEKKIAKKYGMSEADYLASKKEMVVYHG